MVIARNDLCFGDSDGFNVVIGWAVNIKRQMTGTKVYFSPFHTVLGLSPYKEEASDSLTNIQSIIKKYLPIYSIDANWDELIDRIVLVHAIHQENTFDRGCNPAGMSIEEAWVSKKI